MSNATPRFDNDGTNLYLVDTDGNPSVMLARVICETSCGDVDRMVRQANDHDRLVTENQNLRTDMDELSDSRDDFMAQVDRLARMAEAGEELVAAAQAAVDDPEEFNDMAFASQRLTKAIAAYEEASK